MQQQLNFPPLTTEQKNKHLEYVYGKFMGNDKAITKLKRIDFDALGHYNHVNTELMDNIAFLGSAGSGKTHIAKLHNKARELPFVEISPRGIKTVHDMFGEIERTAKLAGLPLIELGHKRNYVLPPMDIFIDEVHACNSMLIQGLLKATEHSDRKLVTEKGITADCKNIHWIIATTDRGKLFDAFDTRFVKITLNLYGKETLSRIVHSHNPFWSMEVCKLVAHYCSRVPREALAFSREMQLEYNMHPASWQEIAKKIASDNDIDEFGMTAKRLMVLKGLAKGPVAEKRLPVIAGCKVEEMDKFILPWLMEGTTDQPAFICVTQKGYALTKSGAVELQKRRISFKPDAIAA